MPGGIPDHVEDRTQQPCNTVLLYYVKRFLQNLGNNQHVSIDWSTVGCIENRRLDKKPVTGDTGQAQHEGDRRIQAQLLLEPHYRRGGHNDVLFEEGVYYEFGVTPRLKKPCTDSLYDASPVRLNIGLESVLSFSYADTNLAVEVMPLLVN